MYQIFKDMYMPWYLQIYEGTFMTHVMQFYFKHMEPYIFNIKMKYEYWVIENNGGDLILGRGAQDKGFLWQILGFFKDKYG